MAVKTLQTRVLLRYDTQDNWTTIDPVLGMGEVACVKVTNELEGDTVLLKVGDGEHKYSELPFTFAKATDVVQAAKSEETLREFINNVAPQPDWNASEGEAGYIKNRTHWIGPTLTPYISSITGVSGVQEVSVGVCLTPGEEYLVTVDGIEYSCTAYDTEGWCVALGDSRLYNPDDMSNPVDLPFFITISEEEGESSDSPWGPEVTYIYVADIRYPDSESHTIEITRVDKFNISYHPLDEKFIPDTIARISDVSDVVNAVAVGKNVKGMSFQIDGVTVLTAEEGAQIFNSIGGPEGNKAVGKYSHAEGSNAIAVGHSSHAEGRNAIAKGDFSHAEGSYSVAIGEASHVEGTQTDAKGIASHSEGYGTIAGFDYQHVQGKYNIEDAEGTYAHIVGNGYYDSTSKLAVRSNAHTLDWNGNAWFQGDVYVGGTSQDDGAKKLATEEYVNQLIPDADSALELVMELGLVNPVADENNVIYTDENGILYTI